MEQEAQLSQKDRAAGCVSFGQKWKNGTGRRYIADSLRPKISGKWGRPHQPFLFSEN